MSTANRYSPLALSGPQQKLRIASRHLPERPGIYMMEDDRGTIIYIGKAVNLRRRVGSYAAPSASRDKKTARLVSQFHQLAFVETASELEALLIEARMIKAKLPAFNRKLIEPESYCFLRTDPGEECPRIEWVQRWCDDGADYLGPFWDTSAVREALEGISNVFMLRRCSGQIRAGSKNWPCMLYEIGKCSGPCSGRIDAAEYRLALRMAWDSFAGRSGVAEQKLISLRGRLADECRFEAAHVVHRQIRALEIIAESNRMLPMINEDFAVVTNTHMKHRPVVLCFKGGRMGDKFIASPHVFPDTDMIERRLRRLNNSGRDLLPGRPCYDDLLIVRSYIKSREQSNFLVPVRWDTPLCNAANSINAAIDSLRHR